MKKAFTLVEVLITLGIIAVVAALTLPNLIADYQKKVTIKQLKAAYNLFSNAIEQAKVDYGDPIILPEDITFAYTTELSQIYFEPYIKGIQPYPTGEKTIYIRTPDKKATYTTFSGYYESTKSMCTPNGVCYKLYRHSVGYIKFFIDLNGPKGPNIMGRDVFELDMSAPYSKSCVYGGANHCIIAPHPYIEGSWSAFGKTIDGYCNKNSDGSSCASKIIRDGWKIAPDYPW